MQKTVSNLKLNVGQTGLLHCAASGNPEPNIIWLKNGQKLELGNKFRILNAGKQLQINASKSEDSGRYTCMATNSVGSTDMDLFLSVMGKFLKIKLKFFKIYQELKGRNWKL